MHSNDSTALSDYSKEELLERVNALEEQLRMTSAFLNSPDPDTVGSRDATLAWFGRQRFLTEKIIPVTLKPIPEESLNHGAGPQHMIIDGDNLSVMTSLLTDFRGGGSKQGFDVIYMDPPYNTGQDIFFYNDHYLHSKKEVANYKQRAPQIERLVSIEDPSRHTKWINHIAPRLWAARKLLKSTGVIIVSIDEHELPRLWMLMEELFGEQNRIATIVWERSRKNDDSYISEGHEYMLVWARDKSALEAKRKIMAQTPEWEYDKGKWRRRKEGVDAILTAYAVAKNKHRGDVAKIQEELDQFFSKLPRSHPARKIRYKKVDANGVFNDDGNPNWPGGGGPRYDVMHPITGKPCKVPASGWRFKEEEMASLITRGRINFKDTHKKVPRVITYLHEMENEVRTSVIRKSGQRSVETVEAILGKGKFKNPKDHEIIAELINLVTWRDPDAKILDPYAGSGTTGHAVLGLNLEDGGNRQFVLIESGTPDTKEKISSKQYTTEITAERVRRVITGQWADGEEHPTYDAGFTFYTAREEITRQSIMGATREQLSDIILQVVEDQSNRIDYRLDGYKYLIGRTAKGYGIALVWGDECDDRDGQTLTQSVRNEILDEAMDAGAGSPVYIYATGRTAAINDELYRFCQIPNWILARLGISELEEVEE